MIKKNAIGIILVLYVIVASITIFFFDGTGDSGDSILHYLFAKYAPLHPELFFNHWAKPLYVLFASPFAQFGIIGIKIFNAIVSFFTIFFSFKIAQKLVPKNSLLITVFLIFSPLFFILTFSGLTEPLFALFLSLGIYSVLKNKYILAALIISFMPFIRSEGLIILGVFGLYFMMKKEWKILPFLLFGHVAYSIAGYFVYDDLLWVFNKIPYAYLSSTYGSGPLFHFVNQLINVTGVPIYVLFLIGIIALIWKSIKRELNLEILVLVFFAFFAFFLAHTMFWYLGIFNSMGLNRVFVGILPIMAIISLIGFNAISENKFMKRKLPKLIIQTVLISYVLIFPFTPNVSAINWQKDMHLNESQKTAIEVSDFVKKNIKSNHRLIYIAPYLSVGLDVDHFNSDLRVELSQKYLTKMLPGDVIIWDSWFSVVERGISKETLENNTDLINIYDAKDKNGKLHYSVFVHK